MDDRDTIRRRIIDRAVDLFNAKNPDGGGLFTTAHYGQAMKAEFKTPGPTLDGATCMEHLSKMGDLVERAGGNMWRRKAQREGRVQSDITEPADEQEGQDADMLLKIEDEVETGVMGILIDGASNAVPDIGLGDSMWWSVGTMADALKNNDLVWDGLLENMVGLVLYAMAVDGRVVSQPNMLVDGARVTVFALAPNGARPPFKGSPDDESFGNSFDG